MTTDQNGLVYTYNAWNMPVTVKNSSDVTLETMTYDGTGRQMTDTVYSGDTGSTTDLYYSSRGRFWRRRLEVIIRRGTSGVRCM